LRLLALTAIEANADGLTIRSQVWRRIEHLS
jgi:hypothetical protein